ncbi:MULTISPECIES: transposase [unclassified Caballeronia]|uniref:IS66-like element accessory protein TnpA n=1 Tax=unclassified Caballeronia TaxID=2646786 RepID=UPI0020284A44|nr:MULTISPECIES: transposase [unclassified Caballeronia]
MSDDEFDFLPLRVIRECSNGKRRYDPEGKRRLIQACLRPGASIAGLALRAQVNANQLHKWIRLHEKANSARAARNTVEPSAAAFIPVLAIEPGSTRPALELAKLPASSSPKQPATASRPTARLSAHLPNGVRVELECSRHDAPLVTALIVALGER